MDREGRFEHGEAGDVPDIRSVILHLLQGDPVAH